MEKRFKLDHNGQQVIQDDFALLGETAAHADDRVFAEVLRLAPYNGSVAKGILPYGHTDSADASTVEPNGASGSVAVNPFRAVIGTRVLAGTDPKQNWRDIRSAIYVSTATTPLSFAANVSGNPRWDLICAVVAVDANSATTTRKVKDPITKVVADQTVSVSVETAVSVAVVAGTPAASPTFPATPSDSGLTYYIPLAYVRVPDGFNATSTVLDSDIALADTVVSLSRVMGMTTSRPASRSATVTSAQQQSWGATGARPSSFMPAAMRGSESLLIPVNLASDTDGTTLDDSQDWRGRLCRFTVMVAPNGENPPWVAAGTAFSPYTHGPTVTASDNACLTGIGQTMVDDTGTGRALAALVAGEAVAVLPDGTKIGVYCDTTTGELKLHVSGAPGSLMAFFWLELSAPYVNR